MRRALAIVRLARPDSSILVFLSVCVPVVSRTGDIALGLRRAAPLLFVSVCTFVLNDLEDLEKDRVNHPDRPLPRGEIKRHTFASHLVQATGDVKAVQEILGHQDIRHTMIYAHTSEDHLREAMGQLPGLGRELPKKLPKPAEVEIGQVDNPSALNGLEGMGAAGIEPATSTV